MPVYELDNNFHVLTSSKLRIKNIKQRMKLSDKWGRMAKGKPWQGKIKKTARCNFETLNARKTSGLTRQQSSIIHKTQFRRSDFKISHNSPITHVRLTSSWRQAVARLQTGSRDDQRCRLHGSLVLTGSWRPQKQSFWIRGFVSLCYAESLKRIMAETDPRPHRHLWQLRTIKKQAKLLKLLHIFQETAATNLFSKTGSPD